MRRADITILACPVCKSALAQAQSGAGLVCSNPACVWHRQPFPNVSGQDCLIDFDNSIIDRELLTGRSAASPVGRRRVTLLVRIVRALLQGTEPVSRGQCEAFVRQVRGLSPKPRVLVVGGGSRGIGTEPLYDASDIEIVSFDVYASEDTDFVADGHSIPLRDETVHGVWVQAVLEHVLEPQRVVDEIWRVLTLGGIVFAETPFMQQVHEGAYDFTRFTHSGHRWLFRRFEELASGAVGGPGVATLWSLRYIFRSIFRSEAVAIGFQLPFFWLRWLDRIVDPKIARDSASAFFFLGIKSAGTLESSDMPAYYGRQTPT